MSNIEKRLAELEKGLKASEKKAKAAEDRAAGLEAKLERTELERKRTAAQLHDVKVQATAEIRRITSMRDLAGPASPYEQDSRERYEELKRTTVKTRDGRRHYYSELACYLSDNGKPPFVYYPKESFVSLPGDVDPSITFRAVKVAGKDPKTGALNFVPIETMLDGPKEIDPAHEVAEDPSSEQPSNAEFNAKREKGREKAAQLGAGAPPKPTPPVAEGATEPELPAGAESQGEGSRPSDTDVG